MSSKTVEDLEKRSRPSGLSWIEELRQVSMAVSKKGGRGALNRTQVFYQLHWTNDARGFGITVHKGRDPETAEEWWTIERAFGKPPPFVDEEDLAILRLLWDERAHDSGLRAFGLGSLHGGEVLRRMALTARLLAASDLSPLLLAPSRAARIAWRAEANGRQRPCFVSDPPASLLSA